MLPIIDLKAPLVDDLQYSETPRTTEHELGLYPRTSHVGTSGTAYGHGRTVPVFRDTTALPGLVPQTPLNPSRPAATQIDCGSILIVDDFEANRRTVARNLKMHGLSVTPAENGRVALELLRERPFDLVLLDIVMPEMDGYQVLEEIRADERLRNIPVVVISGVEDLDSVVRCIELGAADYLFKPFDPVLLQARVRACLETKRLRDQEQAFLQQIQLERAKSDQLLLNILPRPIADRLKQDAGPIAEAFEDVTVLFADLVDFTALAQRVKPAELVGLLNEIFSIFDSLAERFGLEKIKTIGDAYMAVGGIPHALADHADAVAEMALAMQAAIAEYSAELGEDFQLRIGISTGPAIAGVIGRKKFIYDLWGDTVNVASRMETLSRAGCIHISEATRQRLSPRFTCEERGVVYVKGKGEMETFFLTGQR